MFDYLLCVLISHRVLPLFTKGMQCAGCLDCPYISLYAGIYMITRILIEVPFEFLLPDE